MTSGRGKELAIRSILESGATMYESREPGYIILVNFLIILLIAIPTYFYFKDNPIDTSKIFKKSNIPYLSGTIPIIFFIIITMITIYMTVNAYMTDNKKEKRRKKYLAFKFGFNWSVGFYICILVLIMILSIIYN